MTLHTTKNATSAKATLSFYGDDDTGVDSSAANQLELMAGGTAAATVTATGITVPGTLDVTGATSITGTTTMTGTLEITGGLFRVPQVWKLTSVVSSIAGATTGGGFFAVSNPFGAACLITDISVNCGTACTSAAGTVNIGTNANSNSSADNLLDGLALSTAGIFTNYASSGTNGATIRSWASNAFVTGTVATGDVTGAVATVYITAIQI